MARVLKVQVESKIKRKIEMKEPIMKWLVRWAAMSLSRFQVGRDRKTPYERQTGRVCQEEVLPFGERVWFRKLTAHSDKKASMDTKWSEGVWLGHNRGSNESLIGTPQGVMKAWSVRRRIPEERWSNEAISTMKGISQDVQSGVEDTGEDIREWTEAETKTVEEEEKDRRELPRLYLKKKDFKRYGFTQECPGCIRMGRKAPAPYHHNEGCRRRVETKVKRDDPARWKRAQLRKTHEDQEDSTESEQESGLEEEAIADEHGYPAVRSMNAQEEGHSGLFPVLPNPVGLASPELKRCTPWT